MPENRSLKDITKWKRRRGRPRKSLTDYKKVRAGWEGPRIRGKQIKTEAGGDHLWMRQIPPRELAP